jgi:hypothetical protein
MDEYDLSYRYSLHIFLPNTVKPLSITSEGTVKNKRMQQNDSFGESYLYGQGTGTRESEQYLCENNACGNDGQRFHCNT